MDPALKHGINQEAMSDPNSLGIGECMKVTPFRNIDSTFSGMDADIPGQYCENSDSHRRHASHKDCLLNDCDNLSDKDGANAAVSLNE